MIRAYIFDMDGVLCDSESFIAAAAIRLAVATSADEVKLKINLQEMGLEESQFDALVNGLEIEHKKPAPDIFLEAARRLGCDPGESVVFEDAPNGVAAAKAAGARCIGISSSFTAGELRAAGADAVCSGFESLSVSQLLS